MKRRQVLIAFLVCLVVSASLFARPRKAQTLRAEQAKRHVGETAKVCGQMASSHYDYKTRGHPTFLNFDRLYPRRVFTVVIWGPDRAKFGQPDKQYRNKHICVTGPITVYHSQPEIVLHSPSQVTVK